MLRDNFGLPKNMALPKGTVLLPRAGAIASLILLILLVLVPCAVLFFTSIPRQFPDTCDSLTCP